MRQLLYTLYRRLYEKRICASCCTTDTTEFRYEANWDLCLTCYQSWLEHEEYLKENPDD